MVFYDFFKEAGQQQGACVCTNFIQLAFYKKDTIKRHGCLLKLPLDRLPHTSLCSVSFCCPLVCFWTNHNRTSHCAVFCIFIYQRYSFMCSAFSTITNTTDVFSGKLVVARKHTIVVEAPTAQAFFVQRAFFWSTLFYRQRFSCGAEIRVFWRAFPFWVDRFFLAYL